MKTIGQHMKTIGFTTGFTTGFITVDRVLIVAKIIFQEAMTHTRTHNLNPQAKHRFTMKINITPHEALHGRLKVL